MHLLVADARVAHLISFVVFLHKLTNIHGFRCLCPIIRFLPILCCFLCRHCSCTATSSSGICITTIEQLTKTGSMIGNGSNFFPLFYATLSPGLLFIQLFFLKIIEVYCDEFVLILLKVKIGPENQWYQ
ncbi:uncharacterized protein LOC120005322 isoform X1 [Tripterygium wilfordii]|uniref:uncharacterized protein LOC120005322 isoform X1 n=1 Tax=Tripterygium wilfordii TaxID=458696 RepID=UPI0018F7EB34|nr:uncharacterized protein LOC120005322 isoform X1 [Tripterygium wilfordii]